MFGNEFCIPNLSKDGRNWITYLDRLKIAVHARGFGRHLRAETKKPTTSDSDFDTWTLEEAIIMQQITSTIPHSLALLINTKGTVKETYDALQNELEFRARLHAPNLRRRLYSLRCEGDSDIRSHLAVLRTMKEELGALGETISDTEFSDILLGSLPRSYDAVVCAITTAMHILDDDLSPDDLMSFITDHTDLLLSRRDRTKDHADDKRRKGIKIIECFNCHKKGHKNVDCWAKGGGREGQWSGRRHSVQEL
jgi:hypothetical protein